MFTINNNSYVASITDSHTEINAAIRLRFHLYKHCQMPETIKKLANGKQHLPKVQPKKQRVSFADGYDKYTTHIVVKEKNGNTIIAAARLMDSYAAFKLGGFFSETEFDLGNFQNSEYLAEISQVVIHPEHQNQKVFNVLWGAIGDYCQKNRIDRTILNLTLAITSDTQENSREIVWQDVQYVSQMVGKIKLENYEMLQFKVHPYQNLPKSTLHLESVVQLHNDLPPMLRYSLNKGGKLCGDAYWDKELSTANVLLQISAFNREDSQNLDKQSARNVA